MTIQDTSKSLLIPIWLGIGVGVLLGGLLPAQGESVALLGELLFNDLLMLVIPLAIASMIGLILVNMINPGVAGTSEAVLTGRGGLLPQTGYSIGNHQLILNGDRFKRACSDRDRRVIVLDQNPIQANIQPQKLIRDETIAISQSVDETEAEITLNCRGIGVKVNWICATKISGKDRRAIVDLLMRSDCQFTAYFFDGHISRHCCGWNSGSGTGDDGDYINSDRDGDRGNWLDSRSALGCWSAVGQGLTSGVREWEAV